MTRGDHLIASRGILEIVPCGGRIIPRLTPRPAMEVERAATVVVTLPVWHKGGALVIRGNHGEEREDTYRGAGEHITGHLPWYAFLAGNEYEVEEVTTGLRLTISYAVHIKSFGPGRVSLALLFAPNGRIKRLVSKILDRYREKKIGFYLTGKYGKFANPAEVSAKTLVPHVSLGSCAASVGY